MVALFKQKITALNSENAMLFFAKSVIQLPRIGQILNVNEKEEVKYFIEKNFLIF